MGFIQAWDSNIYLAKHSLLAEPPQPLAPLTEIDGG